MRTQSLQNWSWRLCDFARNKICEIREICEKKRGINYLQ